MAESRSPYLVLDRLAKSFGGARVLDGLTLEVERGEVVALLGPSGSGKTTALRLVAGFETPDAGGGRILLEGEDVSRLPPARRNFGMVFQHYALFPHLTVGGNVAFGLEGRRQTRAQAARLTRAQVAERVAAALALVELPGFERRRIGQLSGGQQQRVALARALAPEPRVLLLDEPLSNLDPSLRERTRRELRRAIRRVGITTLLVTHEQEEAFDLGDRVAVLQGGVLHQVGRPEELYDRPETRFVATFVGRANGLAGTLAAGAAGAAAVTAAGAPAAAIAAGASATVLLQAGAAWPGTAAEAMAAGEAVELIVRPEALTFLPCAPRPAAPAASASPPACAPTAATAPAAPAGDGGLPARHGGLPPAAAMAGRVVDRRYAGAVTFYVVELDGVPGGGPPVEVELSAGPDAARIDDRVAVALAPGIAAGRIFRRPASRSAEDPGAA